jgi:orotate phosphoribosyltransferase
MVELIPSQDAVMQILKRTGAFREGHFRLSKRKALATLFSDATGFRYYDTARVLAVALSRKFRLEKDISSQLPKVPSSVRAREEFRSRLACAMHSTRSRFTGPSRSRGERQFRQYVNQGEVNPCIIVDDIIRSGHANQRDRGPGEGSQIEDYRLRRHRSFRYRA